MKKLSILLFAAMMAVSLCGCVWFMNEPEEEQQSTAVYEPVQDEIEVTPEPARKENPVSAFYSDYYDACGAMEELFQSRLEGEPSKETADTLIYLAEHDLAVSQGKITFGWLLSTDAEGSFSSSVSGAAEGSGTITAGIAQPRSEDTLELSPLMTPQAPQLSPIPGEMNQEQEQYTLSFQFASGDTMSGTLTAEGLEYTQNKADGSSVEIITEDGVWESTVVRGDGLITILRCDGKGLHFTVAESIESHESGTDIYNWTSDSAGARRI
ncbi:MAG: hypothetical protein IKU32_04735 [Clostridia bacterium]|nr:hypothetical protein [Clostridia bacterium]